MFDRIYHELRHHAPFTILGAISGVVLMLLFRNLPQQAAYRAFYVFHPIHVLLSALATASMYEFHKCRVDRKKCNILILLLIGYFGSVGIATLSDSLIPYLGETLLDMPQRSVHIGFIEEWWLISPSAIIGVAIAYFRPNTKFSHYGHVLLSTCASLFHILMAGSQSLGWASYVAIYLFLFLAVWLPCCISDIIFPLLFVKDKNNFQPH